MDDAEGVGLGEGLPGLQHPVDDVRDEERRMPLDEVREILPLQVLHDHVRSARLERAYIEHTHAVLAADADGGLGLPQEPLHHLLVLEHGREEELDGDPLIELEVPRRDHGAHPPEADDALDPVLAEDDVTRLRLSQEGVGLLHGGHGTRFGGGAPETTTQGYFIAGEKTPGAIRAMFST